MAGNSQIPEGVDAGGFWVNERNRVEDRERSRFGQAGADDPPDPPPEPPPSDPPVPPDQPGPLPDLPWAAAVEGRADGSEGAPEAAVADGEPVAPTAAVAVPPPAETAIGLFDFDRSTLRADTRRVLDEQVVAPRAGRAWVELISVSGHADRIGAADYNQRLSERRVEAVKAYLVARGIPAERVLTRGFGSTRPAVGAVACAAGLPRETLIACLQPHRRVEVEVPAPRDGSADSPRPPAASGG